MLVEIDRVPVLERGVQLAIRQILEMPCRARQSGPVFSYQARFLGELYAGKRCEGKART